jgi:hypothetical protein
MKHGKDERGKAPKKPYRRPRLVVHGDIRVLTAVKKGKKGDGGGGKPKTFASGSQT